MLAQKSGDSKTRGHGSSERVGGGKQRRVFTHCGWMDEETRVGECDGQRLRKEENSELTLWVLDFMSSACFV